MSELGIATLQNIGQAVESLSGGQRQGVAVARSAAFGSKVVILDEPTAALGVKEGNRVLQLIRDVRDRGPAGHPDQPQHAARLRGRRPHPHPAARPAGHGDHPAVALDVRGGGDHDRRRRAAAAGGLTSPAAPGWPRSTPGSRRARRLSVRAARRGGHADAARAVVDSRPAGYGRPLAACSSRRRPRRPRARSRAPAPPSAPAPADPGLPGRLVAGVTGDGAFAHLQELQRIADAHAGNRALGTPGYDASVDYVAGVLRAAGYQVQTPEFAARRFSVQDQRLTVDGAAGGRRWRWATPPPPRPAGSPRRWRWWTARAATPPRWPGCPPGRCCWSAAGPARSPRSRRSRPTAGAAALLVVNNEDGPLSGGTLGEAATGTVPTAGVSRADGDPLFARAGAPVSLVLDTTVAGDPQPQRDRPDRHRQPGPGGVRRRAPGLGGRRGRGSTTTARGRRRCWRWRCGSAPPLRWPTRCGSRSGAPRRRG